MYDLLFDYFRTTVWISTDSSLDTLMDSLSHVFSILVVASIILVIFGFMKRALYWLGSMFGGEFI